MSALVRRTRGWGTGVAMLCALTLAGCVSVGPDGAREVRPARDPADADRVANVRLELAAGYLSRGQPEIALEEIRAALAVKPAFPAALNLRGLAHLAQGDFRASEQSFQRALELAPQDGDTLHNYGWMLCQARRHAEAEVMFRRALAQPQYTQRLRTLGAEGFCLARAGRLAEAERALSRAYELDPANAGVAFNLSEVLYQLGQFDRARFYIGRVNAQREQSNAQTLWLAARIEQRTGNVAAAQVLGRQIVDRFPSSTEALQFSRGRFDD